VENPQALYFFWRHDKDGNFTYVSPSVTTILGFSPEEFLGHFSTHLPDSQRTEEVQTMTALSLTGKQLAPYLVDSYHADGSLRTLEIFEVPVFDDQDNVVAVEGMAHDVTEHQSVLERLRESEEGYKDLVEKAGIAILIDDEEGNPVFFNETYLKLYGYTAEEIRQQTVGTLVHPEDQEMMRRYHKARLRGEDPPSRYRFRGITREGAVRHIEVEASPMRREGSIRGTHAYLWDVTETVRLEEELRRSRDHLEEIVRERTEALRNKEEQLRLTQRLKAIGTLAGGIAHDFNNLLTSILGYAEALSRRSDLPEEVLKSARIIKHAAERGAELTNQLLGFARSGKLRNAPLDVHNVLENIIAFLGRTLDKRIEIVREFHADPPFLMGDVGQLEEVFLNLAVNARDAMPKGGRLTFTTGIVTLKEEERPPQLEAFHEELLTVSVKDTGVGIPEAYREHLFEPFFTTKEPGAGTGMGLAMVWGIVKNHGGYIRVISEPGKGSEFRIHFPLCREGPRPEPEEAAAPPPAEEKRRGQVLVIDDEPAVCLLFEALLTDLGYTTHCFQNPVKALEHLRSGEDEFDFVILDMLMPVMGGREVFNELRRTHPGLPVLLCTGHAGIEGVEDMLREGLRGILRKPFLSGDLAEAIDEALGGEHPG
jgi:PAS domain S-box-containing protein